MKAMGFPKMGGGDTGLRGEERMWEESDNERLKSQRKMGNEYV